jgi:hypothetical protein
MPPITGVLEEREIHDAARVHRSADGLLPLATDDDALDILGLLNELPERLGHRDEIRLRVGDLVLLWVTVHKGQVAGEARQLPIARTRLGLRLLEIFRNRDVQFRARSHRPIDGVANRRHGAIAEEHHKLEGEPMAEMPARAARRRNRVILLHNVAILAMFEQIEPYPANPLFRPRLLCGYNRCK